MPDEPLRIAIRNAVRATLAELRSSYPDEVFYCFALYTTPEVTYILPTASGEAGLAEVAAECAGKGNEQQLANEMEELRWSPVDSPYHLVGEEHFAAVQALLDARPQPVFGGEDGHTEFDEEIAARLDACFGALRDLDAQGVFGTDADREQIIVTVLQGDQSDRSRLENAERVGNPPLSLETLASGLNIREPEGRVRYLGADPVYQIDDLTVSADLSTVAACGSGGELYAFSWPAGERLPASSRRGDHRALGLSGDGKLLVVSDRQKLCRYTLPSGNALGGSTAHKEQICAVAVSPDGKQILSAGRDNTIAAWDGESLEQLWTVALSAVSLRYAPDGNRVVAAGSGVWILNTTDGAQLTRLVKPNKKKPWYLYCAAWSHNGERIAVAAQSEPGTIRIYKTGAKTPEVTFTPKDHGVSAVDFSRNGRHLASAHQDGHLHVWHTVTGECVSTLHARHESMCGGCRWLDERHIAASGRDVDRSPPICVFDVGHLLM